MTIKLVHGLVISMCFSWSTAFAAEPDHSAPTSAAITQKSASCPAFFNKRCASYIHLNALIYAR